jgi:hypothetical protein
MILDRQMIIQEMNPISLDLFADGGGGLFGFEHDELG